MIFANFSVSNMLLPFIFIAILLLGKSNCKVDFCNDNILPQTNSFLQFTKELSVNEFAVESKFKSLHCCAHGYLSIEWFKDGRPYPWPGDVSSLILYPESANQTVYTQTIKTSDAGNYTCHIHNDTAYIIHSTVLKVFDSSGYMQNPLATYRPPEESTASVGQKARLYCEAFVGQIDLPDATNEVTWSKEGNDTLDSPRISEQKVQREGGQIVGKFLLIENVNWTDFGTYFCTISNTGDQKIVMKTELKSSEWPPPGCTGRRSLFIFAFTITFVVLILYNLITFCKIKMSGTQPSSSYWLKVMEIRRMFTWTRKPKGNSLIVIHAEGDREFVDNTFLPLLHQNPHLSVVTHKITKKDKITEDLRKLYLKTEKTVILMSRHLITEWTIKNINRALEDIMSCNRHSSHCVVLLEQLPIDTSEDSGERLRCLQNKFVLSVWNEEMAMNGHPFWTNKVAINNASQPGLRVPKSSVVITAASPFRCSFMRMTKTSQPTEVSV